MKLGKTALLKFLDNTLGPLLCRTLGYLHFRLYPARYPAPLDIHAVKRVLVIRPGGIGDMLMLLPVLTHLSASMPQTTITVLCEKRNRHVLTMARFRGSVLTYDSVLPGFLFQLFRGSYDLAIDTEQFHHFSAIFSLLSRAPIRIGFNINPRRNSLYSHLVPYAPDGAEGEQFMRLLRPLPIPTVGHVLQGALNGFTSTLPPTLVKQLSEGDSTRQRYVAIHAGSSSPYKHWESSKFVELAIALAKDMHIQPVFVGGADDAAFARTVTQALAQQGHSALSLVGETSLEETAAVIQHAAAFLGLDSGLAHIAVALGRPSVVLFGPTDPAKWGTDAGHHKVIYKAVPCSPCALFGYFRPCNTFACMKLISTGEVVSALRKVL